MDINVRGCVALEFSTKTELEGKVFEFRMEMCAFTNPLAKGINCLLFYSVQSTSPKVLTEKTLRHNG